MQCLQCQYANPAAAKFCLNCGTRLPQVCAQCKQVPTGSKILYGLWTLLK